MAATTVYDWRYTSDEHCYAIAYEGGFRVYIFKKRLDGRAKAKGKQLRKGPKEQAGHGVYPTRIAAEGEVFLWRMDVEGYVQDDDGNWSHPRRRVVTAMSVDDDDDGEGGARTTATKRWRQ